MQSTIVKFLQLWSHKGKIT